MKEHKISLSTAVLLSMNILIGSGILIGPGQIAEIAGNASFLAWPIVALFFLPLVLCTAQLSNMFPGCGGFYSYAKEGINKKAGFISGWLYIVGYTFAIAVDLLALRKTFLALGFEYSFITNVAIFNLIFISIAILLNLMSFKFFSQLLNSLTITKILPLVILILLLPFILNPGFSISSTELSLVPGSLSLAIFGFFGFEYCCSMSHLIENSEKNAPKAIVLGFLITAALYTLFHFGLLNLMGADKLAQLGASSFAQFVNLPIPYFKQLLMLLIPFASILTIFAASNGILNANGILLHSMAQEKLFIFSSPLTKVNKNGRPWVALLLLGIVIFIISTLIADIDLVAALCNLAVFLSFILPFVSLLILQKRKNMNSKIALTVIAIIATVCFSIYSWLLLGGNNSERLFNTLPIAGALILGYSLFVLSKNTK